MASELLPQPFPSHALPEPLATFVRQCALATGCDEALVALPVLAMLGGAIGTTRRIHLKSQWFEFPIVWAIVVSPSGTQKSAGLDEALRPLQEAQRKAFEEYEHAISVHRFELAEREESRKASSRRGNSERKGVTDRPVEPVPRRYLVQDVTVEALAPILKENCRGVLLARDEAAGWFRGFDAYKSNRGADAAQWLEMHGGRSITVDRKGGDPRTIYVPNAAVSVTGTIQPGVLASILGPQQFESGLSARLLLAMPPRRKKQWTDAEIPEAVRAQYAAVVNALLRLQHGKEEGVVPIDVPLSDEARETFIEFYNSHAEAQAALDDEALSAAFSKLEGYAARFALIIHCVREVCGELNDDAHSAIDTDSMKRGITLANWFSSEARRVYTEFRMSDYERELRDVRAKVKLEGGRITARELQRTNQQRYKKAEDARAALDGLVKSGGGKWVKSQTGGRPTDTFVLADGSDSDKSQCPTNIPSVTVTCVSSGEIATPIRNGSLSSASSDVRR